MSPIAIVVVNYGTPELVARLLGSLQGHPDATLVAEVVLVDNGFPQRGDLRQTIRPQDYPFPIRFVQNESASYGSGANRGAAIATAPLIAISNSDIEWLPDGGLAPILEEMQRDPRIGVAGPQLLYPDGAWQRSFGPFPSVMERLRAVLFLEVLRGLSASRRYRRGDRMSRPVDYVDGAFMVIRRACFDDVRGFDERFRFYAEDADFCWRAARAGWERKSIPAAHLQHLRGASSRERDATGYMTRLVAARRAFVAHHFGERMAKWYLRLERVTSAEEATVYPVLSAMSRTPAWRRRARLARLWARAAWRLPNEAAPPTP